MVIKLEGDKWLKQKKILAEIRLLVVPLNAI